MPSRSLSSLAALLLLSSPAWAQSTSPAVTERARTLVMSGVLDTTPCRTGTSPVDRAWQRAWAELTRPQSASRGPIVIWHDDGPFAAEVAASQDTPAAQEAQRKRPKAIEYSEGYGTRAKIHRYASFATLPLFITQAAIGQSLYSNAGTGEGGGKKGAHGALTVGIAGLFGLNSVTGVWNLKEAWKDPNGRTRRTLHGIMMLVADAGFVATGALAPGEREGHEQGGTFQAPTNSNKKATHRAVAISSMGIATVSYLMMLLWRP